MQNDESFNYIFGDEHAKVSLSKDLVDRETNVVLIDEFDKVLPIYYNVSIKCLMKVLLKMPIIK
ncbi:ClpA-like protein [Staphylococcus aureus]|uniref:ClpA-like protein n=1 Tax=Staphylococcus aureus TaxID=1280 RepID=A0A380END6_STAAU|nr:ClpA-like protein [Staphylococcus aureus]